MSYTVKKLARLSGISIRTLRFYDTVGLLKPAYYGDNLYRYYEEEQVLMLQQILFYRELGFSLKYWGLTPCLTPCLTVCCLIKSNSP